MRRSPNNLSHPIIQEVAALNMPQPDQVVIHHGSALAIHGLVDEPVGDIDIVTNLPNVQYLRSLGWMAVRNLVGTGSDGEPKYVVCTRDIDPDTGEYRFDAYRWAFSPTRYRKTGRGRIYLPEQFDRSVQDSETGIWVALLDLIRDTKAGSGRPKDEAAVELIDQALGRNAS